MWFAAGRHWAIVTLRDESCFPSYSLYWASPASVFTRKDKEQLSSYGCTWLFACTLGWLASPHVDCRAQAAMSATQIVSNSCKLQHLPYILRGRIIYHYYLCAVGGDTCMPLTKVFHPRVRHRGGVQAISLANIRRHVCSKWVQVACGAERSSAE